MTTDYSSRRNGLETRTSEPVPWGVCDRRVSGPLGWLSECLVWNLALPNPGEKAGTRASSWGVCLSQQGSEGSWSFRFWPGPTLTIVGVWGVTWQMEDLIQTKWKYIKANRRFQMLRRNGHKQECLKKKAREKHFIRFNILLWFKEGLSKLLLEGNTLKQGI